MSTRRAQRVATMIRQEIATMILAGEFRDPAISPAITITGATVSPDLRSAKVTVSMIGVDPDAEARAFAALGRITPYLRGELARRLALRTAPELRFVLDRSLQYAQEIEEIVARVLPAASDPPDAEPSDDV